MIVDYRAVVGIWWLEQRLRGFVPLAEMFGYATDLRSKTQGRGNYSMFFEKYEPVPKSVQAKVLEGKSAN